jgi:hypothetical protein
MSILGEVADVYSYVAEWRFVGRINQANIIIICFSAKSKAALVVCALFKCLYL